jgi:hypothetical protein
MQDDGQGLGSPQNGQEMDLLARKSSAREIVEAILAMEEKLRCCITIWISWLEKTGSEKASREEIRPRSLIASRCAIS